MIAAPRKSVRAGAMGGDATAHGVADWLSLAAAPSFAMMALLTEVFGSRDVLCAAAHDASPLSGMVPMYLLMSALHLAPWFRLICRRLIGTGQS